MTEATGQVPEAVWESCASPYDLLLYAGPLATERKLLLFACECQRRIWHLLEADAPSRTWVVPLESYADGHLARTLLPADLVEVAAIDVANRWARDAILVNFRASHSLDGDEIRAQATLARDLFGPLPFRPVALSPEWRTDTAVALARQMYESRDFGAMAILADALQDAGCDSADVLDHCRGPGPHVRGCWVVDLVLGKE
jgi:hypothetical protein